MSAERTPSEIPLQTDVVAAGLASEPWSIAAVATLWIGIGLRVAWVEARRGHDIRYLVALGVAFGPLLFAYARSSLRRLEQDACPIVIRDPIEPGAGPRLLVALLCEPNDVADARPLLQLLTNGGARLDLARPVTFDAARGRESESEYRVAIRDLERAGLLLHDLDPGLVVVSGGAAGVRKFAAERSADFVVVLAPGNPPGDQRLDVRVGRPDDLRSTR